MFDFAFAEDMQKQLQAPIVLRACESFEGFVTHLQDILNEFNEKTDTRVRTGSSSRLIL